jgi:DNA (cytosine-5)-methyltransferase 3A
MGKQLNFEDPRSKLFFEYVRIKNTLQPRWFLLENVRVQNDIRDEFTRLLGVEPVLIDSALFSAQSRKRYYWTNIHIQPIVDKNILFNKTVCQRRFNGPIFAGFVKKCFTILTVTKVRVLDDDIDLDSIRKEKYSIKLGRALSIAELENLQTLPDGYTDQCGSYSSREKLIGNAWTVDVVSHIFNGLRFDNGYIGTE